MHEEDYEHIIRADADRYPFMQEFMSTVVTDTLKKTAKSYAKKSKLLFTPPRKANPNFPSL